MRRITTIALLPIAAFVLAACNGTSQETTDAGPGATLSPGAVTATDDGSGTTESPESGDTAGSGDELFGTAADVGGPYGELRDGLWSVGPAGDVEFTVTGSDTLELVQATANEGWAIAEQEVESDKVDVDFRRGPVRFQFEVEVDDGILELEIDQDIDPAQPGTFSVGEAGTVEVDVQDGRLVLGEVTLTDGWTEVKRAVEADDIELDFRREGDGFFELWEFHADLDNGTLEVEVDYELEGRLAR